MVSARSSFQSTNMSELNVFTLEGCKTVVRSLLTVNDVLVKNFKVSQFPKQEFTLDVVVNYKGKDEILKFVAKYVPRHSVVDRIFGDFRKTLGRFNECITPPQLVLVRSKYYFVEDFNRRTFDTCSSRDFDLDHFEVVLKALAKVHAASFAFQRAKAGTSEFKLDERYDLDVSWLDLENNQVRVLLSSVFGETKVDNASKVLNERHSFPKTLCHANLTRDNILFKYANGKPVECRLISFSAKYAPPICDVLQLILFHATENMRQLHNIFLETYHECLRQELGNYDLDVDKTVPKNDLQVSGHHFLPLVKLERAVRLNEGVDELKEALTCPIFSREDCFAVIANKQISNYKFTGFSVTPLDEVNGFLGDYHKLKVTIRQQSDDVTLNCFIKRLPKASAPNQLLKDSGGFFKEVFVYITLASKFRQLGVTTFDECLPACYFHRHEDLFVFEDLNVQDFAVLAAQKPFNFELLGVVVKKLARFHASGLVYEEKLSEKLGRPYRLNQDYQQFFIESINVKSESHAGGRLMANGLRAIRSAANLLPELNTEDNARNLEKSWSKLVEIYYTVITSSDEYRNVLTHGDLWSSNILVHGNDDCRFVDYQLLRYCPPGHDLLAVLHLTTDRATRLQHEDQLTKIYYTELKNVTASYNYDIDKVYPYEEFQRGMEYMRPQMILQAIIYGMLTLCTSEEIATILSTDEICNRVFYEDRTDFLKEMFALSPVYKKGMSERILDLYDYCNSLAQ